jgi:hypothetical protein
MVAFRPRGWEGEGGERRQEARRSVDTVKSMTGASAWGFAARTTTCGASEEGRGPRGALASPCGCRQTKAATTWWRPHSDSPGGFLYG